MSVRSVQPNGALLFEIALAIFGVGIGLPSTRYHFGLSLSSFQRPR